MCAEQLVAIGPYPRRDEAAAAGMVEIHRPQTLRMDRFVAFDGELLIPHPHGLSAGAVEMRLNPLEPRSVKQAPKGPTAADD